MSVITFKLADAATTNVLGLQALESLDSTESIKSISFGSVITESGLKPLVEELECKVGVRGGKDNSTEFKGAIPGFGDFTLSIDHERGSVAYTGDESVTALTVELNVEVQNLNARS